MRKRTAFTLVEVLVVLAITAILVALLLPSLKQAKATAIVTMCASNMRQQGIMTNNYVADCKEFLPLPTTAHRLTYSLGSPGSASKDIYPSPAIMMMTRNDPTGSLLTAIGPCPLSANGTGGSDARSWPTGYGWFYWQGYLPKTVHKSSKFLGVMECPGSPRFWGNGPTYDGSTYSDHWEILQSEYSVATGIFERNALTSTSNNAGGVNATYCCYPRTNVEYINRGWFRNSSTVPTPRLSQWKPGNAYAIDLEYWQGGAFGVIDYDVGWPRKHNGKINILFIDGHVRFGAKDLFHATAGRAVPPAVYYGLQNGKTYAGSYTLSGANSGVPSNGGDNPMGALWAYYESDN